MPAPWVASTCILLAAPAVLAQSAGTSRSVALQPTASITQTFTNNYLVSGVDPASDAITRLTAGLAFRGQSGLVRGFLDYSLSSLVHARHSDHNSFQNALNAVLGAELLEGRARVDLVANIAQSAVSAFGAQPGSSSNGQSNSTEVRNLRITPSFQGPLGPNLRYSADLSHSLTDAGSSGIGDSTSTSASVHLEPAGAARLGWTVDGSVLRSDYKAGRTTESDRVFGGVKLRLDDLDLRLQANTGLELTDLATAGRQSYRTWGLGAVWTPSPRTQVSGQYEHRFFGASHSVSLTHRTALTVWRVTSSRSVSTSGGQDTGSGRGTAFDLLFTDSRFIAAEPDLGKRADLVKNTLLSLGFDDVQSNPGFLRSTATVQNRQEISAAWRGARSTAILAYSRTVDQQLGLASSVLGDFASTAEVRLQRLSLDLSQRLTPIASLSLLLSEQRGTGSQATLRNVQRQASLLYTTRPSIDASLSLGLRRSLYDNQPVSYNETALFATYGLRF